MTSETMDAREEAGTTHDEALAEETDRLFFEALREADGAALELLLDPAFLIVDVGTGSVNGKRELIDAVREGQVRFSRIDVREDQRIARTVGEVVVIVGATQMEVETSSGPWSVVASRYTHLFARDPDGTRWRLVSAQGTPIR